jgi:predicted TIM-barrel fold metal-dependent hydrolase
MAELTFAPPADVTEIRSRINHPIIDGDGHHIEYLPLVRDLLVDATDESFGVAFDQVVTSSQLRRQIPVEKMRQLGATRTSWWGLPADTLDRATAMLPGLLYSRLDQMGIDYALLYPTYGLVVTGLPNDELRPALARAFNAYAAEAYAPFRDRLCPVAAIPMSTPEEAIAELEYAVGELGMKAVMMNGAIVRRLPGLEDHRPAHFVNPVGHGSIYDYDPVWQRCVELGVAPTFHGSGMGWGSRASVDNYVANHIGNFAAAGEAACRSLVLGGAPMRFPELPFAFLEGGVAWGANLFSDTLGHFEKRNRTSIEHYNPNRIDRPELEKLFESYASSPVLERMGGLDTALLMLSDADEDPATIDEFAESGLRDEADLVRVFTEQFYFGCEADDPMNAMAFQTRLNPHQARFQAVFASDIGHWDVPDMTGVLPEAWELVDDGHISLDDFADFTFANITRLMTAVKPDFFHGTSVEDATNALLS